ncbi:hypothetical protein ACFLSZ_06065 [Candidatus Bipolaricaulota bacterium]
MHEELEELSVLDLLRLHAAILSELISRGIVRSKNNPIADYAEYLVCKALALTLMGKSNKGFDAVDKSSKRYEIKARRESKDRKTTLTSPIRDLEGEHFDELIIVLFGEDYTVKKAVQLPRRLVKQVGRFVNHVNGWVIPLRDSLWTTPGCTDITQQLRRCQ